MVRMAGLLPSVPRSPLEVIVKDWSDFPKHTQDETGPLPRPLVRTRPSRPGSLNAEDLKPGLWIEIHYTNLGETLRACLLGAPYSNESGFLVVDMLPNADEFSDEEIAARSFPSFRLNERSLSDMGVTPYADGLWNPDNYCTRAPVQHSLQEAASAS